MRKIERNGKSKLKQNFPLSWPPGLMALKQTLLLLPSFDSFIVITNENKKM